MSNIKELKHVEGWCEGRAFYARILAREIVSCAAAVTEFATLRHKNLRLGKSESSSLQSWLALYDNPKQAWAAFLKAKRHDSPYAAQVVHYNRMARSPLCRIRRWLFPFRYRHSTFEYGLLVFMFGCGRASIRNAEKALGEFEELQRLEMLENANDNKPLRIENDSIVLPAAFYFVANSLLTSYVAHGETIEQLLTRARDGDADGLEKLLRLDPRLCHDERIAEMAHSGFCLGRTNYHSMAPLLAKGVKGKVTPGTIKVRLAGFLSSVSMLGDFLGGPPRLTEPEIRALFDAYAKDLGHGDIDTDLPLAPQAFAKALQRGRKFWGKIVPHPDKK